MTVLPTMPDASLQSSLFEEDYQPRELGQVALTELDLSCVPLTTENKDGEEVEQ